MTSGGWTRAASADLARTAMQVGLLPDDAESALMIGARMRAHGFTGHDIDNMIQDFYRRAAGLEPRPLSLLEQARIAEGALTNDQH